MCFIRCHYFITNTKIIPNALYAYREFPKFVNFIHRIIPDEPVQINPSPFPDGVAAYPPPQHGIVVAVAVVVEAGFTVIILGAEQEIERIGEVAPLIDYSKLT